MSDVEELIEAKGLTAPRITSQHIDETIVAEDYHVFPGTQVTVCCLTLKNGYCVVGMSACASPENFDEEIGHKIARQDAWGHIWALEGYLLKEHLAMHPASESLVMAHTFTTGCAGNHLVNEPCQGNTTTQQPVE